MSRYNEIYKQVGTVYKLGEDGKLLNTKSLIAVNKDMSMKEIYKTQSKFDKNSSYSNSTMKMKLQFW